MLESKNILFITHHNNDFDHFLPLIVHLKKDKDIHIKILAFYNKHNLLKNRLHRYICDSNDINLDSMTDICYFNWINRAAIKIYEYVLNNVKAGRQTKSRLEKIKWGIADIIKSPGDTILRMLRSILIKYLVLCSIFLLSNKKMIEYIDKNNIDLAIIDQRETEESLIDSNPFTRFINIITGKTDEMNNVLFRFAKRVREKKVPIFMMPHGPQPILKKIPDAYLKPLKNPFRPDFLVMGSKAEFSTHRHMHGIKSTFYLGDPRFDIRWINYLESCALKVYGDIVKKPKDKTVLLYLMDIFTYTKEENEDYKLEIHKDILSLVNHFPNLEVWVKHHPRTAFEIPIDNFIIKDKRKNIKQFGNDTDTNILLTNADVCVAALTTTFISPILQKKPVIFYNKGMKKLHDATSIFDDLKFKASSKEELISQYKKIVNNEYTIDDSFLNTFYKNVFSVDLSMESMVEKYGKKIKEILETGKV